MFISRFGLLGLLIGKAVEAISDRLFKSSLDEDFGEATEDDIILPDARHIACGQIDDLAGPLAHMFNMIDGVTVGHLEKVTQRMPELRIGRPVTYAFQVKDTGTPVEMQLILTKQPNHEVEIDFRSSEGVIRLVKVAINES